MNNIFGWMGKLRCPTILVWCFWGVSSSIFLFTCQRSQDALPPRIQLSKLLLNDHLNGDTIPLADSLLLTYLPIHLSGYPKTNYKGHTFHSPSTRFSYAERIYHGRNRLSISISDFAGDSTSFLHFWDSYQFADTTHLVDRFYQVTPFMFGWTEEDTTRKTLVKYVALKQRFWVEIKINYIQLPPEDKKKYAKELDRVFKTIKNSTKKIVAKGL